MNYDLGDLSQYDGELPPVDRPVDTSGRPHPTRAFARCSDGNDIPIHVAYKGIQDPPPGHPFGKGPLRVYRLVIEGGWGRIINRIHTIAIDNFAVDIVTEFSDVDDVAADKDAVYRMLQRIRWHHLDGDQTPGMGVNIRTTVRNRETGEYGQY